MTSVLRASFLSRGRQWISLTNFSKSRQFASLDSRYQRQAEREILPNQAKSFISSKVLDKCERLYEGTLHKRIRSVKIFSLATSTGSLLCQPYLISKVAETGSSVGVGGIEFKPEDVKLPEISEMLTSCFVKGIPMFMDVQNFTNIDHYKRIMGFDKPMDFSFPTEDMNSKGK
ncbi:transmembrane protein 70 homolog, mitochondrial isoform X2 [Venturia canescens]|uniref:transmembrane protein 70 homolog, mitochondrial isoform X2 n=1 Tax=Venturia canescens TaxID=32260 RepID=UPI001C9D059C|nr:transmembrane protein 70 homolog, mitochondrial isoform X2 [Venturia canescens]